MRYLEAFETNPVLANFGTFVTLGLAIQFALAWQLNLKKNK
jgi:hypothetical protein